MYVPRARPASTPTLPPAPHRTPAPRPPSTAHIFHPLPPFSLRSAAPKYRYPHVITTYSHHADRHIAPGDASMPYYRECPIGADLNYGFDRRIERTGDEEEHLDGLCEALQRTWESRGAAAESHGEGDEAEQGERKGGVITWRGMLTRIMTAPYDRDPWEMTAIALDGSVYIELYEPPDVRAASKKRQSAWAMQSYWGVAYESYATATTPSPADADADVASGDVPVPESREGRAKWPEGWSGDVNTNVQWCNVVRSSIGDIPVCIGGEVDCVDAEPGASHPGLEKCMELKTNGPITNANQERTFHKKLLKHWAQSYLLGIPKVEVGFRDQEGIVRSRRMFDTLSIPRLVEAAPEPQWHPTPALTFLHSTLTTVLQHVLPTDPAPAWRERVRGERSQRSSAGAAAGAELGMDAGHTRSALPLPLPPATVWRFSYVPRRGCELWCVGEYPFEGEEGERWGGVLREGYVRWRLERGL